MTLAEAIERIECLVVNFGRGEDVEAWDVIQDQMAEDEERIRRFNEEQD